MINVTPLNPHDPELFAAWYAAYHEGAAAGRHAPVVYPEAVVLDQLTQESRAVRRPFGVFDGLDCLGAAVLEWDTEQNTHLGNIEIYVPPRHRRTGVGTALLDRLSQEADDACLTTLIAEVNAVTPEAAGLHFARQAGFSTVLTEDHQVLDLPVPAARLAQWQSVSDAPALGFTVHAWQGATPPERRDQMAEIQNAMNADVPTGDMDIDPHVLTVEELVAQDGRLARRGYVTFTTLALTPNGEPVGFTRIYAQSSDPSHALQDDTWVHVDHRGHRIGAWLKSVNIALVQSAVPEARFLHTSNAQTNDAIQSLNRRFGFRRTEVLHEMQRGGRSSPASLDQL